LDELPVVVMLFYVILCYVMSCSGALQMDFVWSFVKFFVSWNKLMGKKVCLSLVVLPCMYHDGRFAECTGHIMMHCVRITSIVSDILI
jgi:hypothetical protein